MSLDDLPEGRPSALWGDGVERRALANDGTEGRRIRVGSTLMQRPGQAPAMPI
jgi:hypothetical protein